MTEINGMSIVGRIRMVVAAGALPGTVLAGLGDFFSPIGGWLVPLLAGLFAALLLVFLIVRGGAPERLRTVVNDSIETSGTFEGPLHRQPGVWALAVFAFIGIFVGVWSRADSGSGGLLASKLAIVSDMQQITGLMQRGLEEQQRARVAVEGIERTVKRETSDDPRKELANQGIAWNSNGIEDAIRNGDARTLQLFIEGGMKVPPAFFKLALKEFDADVISVLSKNPAAVRSVDCIPQGFGFRSLLNESAVMEAYIAVCDRPEVENVIRDELAQLAADSAKQLHANAAVQSSRKSCKKRIATEYPISKIASVAFPGEINGNATVGDIPEELVASKMSIFFLTPRALGENQDQEAFYENAVLEACESYYQVRDIDTSRADFLNEIVDQFR